MRPRLRFVSTGHPEHKPILVIDRASPDVAARLIGQRREMGWLQGVLIIGEEVDIEDDLGADP